jgi:hypothetical protein
MTLPGSEPAAAPTDPDALADRVRRVGEQPLEERAAGFGALHEELRTRLEQGGAGA